MYPAVAAAPIVPGAVRALRASQRSRPAPCRHYRYAVWAYYKLLLSVKYRRLPARPPKDERTSALTDLREGWTYFRATTWLWVVVLAFGFLNAIHTGAWFTLGPAQAKATIGAGGWGLVLSAESLGSPTNGYHDRGRKGFHDGGKLSRRVTRLLVPA